MIKAKLSNGTIILALSALNIDRLKNGEPIKFDGRPLGFPGDVGIIYGETEYQILQELKDATETRQ